MRDRLHGYSPAELDKLIWRVFSEWPDEVFVARQLRVPVRDVSAALERFATRVAVLADQHWCGRLARQIDELIQLTDRLVEIEDPPRVSTAARVRLAALRQLFLAAAGTPTPAPTRTPAVPDIVVTRRVRRFDRTPTQPASELAAAE